MARIHGRGRRIGAYCPRHADRRHGHRPRITGGSSADPARHVLQLVESLDQVDVRMVCRLAEILDRWHASTAAGLKIAATVTGPASGAPDRPDPRPCITGGSSPDAARHVLPPVGSLDRWHASTAAGLLQYCPGNNRAG